MWFPIFFAHFSAAETLIVQHFQTFSIDLCLFYSAVTACAFGCFPKGRRHFNGQTLFFSMHTAIFYATLLHEKIYHQWTGSVNLTLMPFALRKHGLNWQ
jgi:hypothetical protein